MGEGHPEQPDRLRAIERALESEVFQMLARDAAPRAETIYPRMKRYRPTATAARSIQAPMFP
jgi:hypothetical protein